MSTHRGSHGSTMPRRRSASRWKATSSSSKASCPRASASRPRRPSVASLPATPSPAAGAEVLGGGGGPGGPFQRTGPAQIALRIFAV